MCNLHDFLIGREQAGISHQSWQQEASDRDSWRSSVRKAICKFKPQRKNAGGRKSEQRPYHPCPEPSSVQSAVGGAHQESVSTATNERARIDHQPSQQSSSARNELSGLVCVYLDSALKTKCNFKRERFWRNQFRSDSFWVLSLLGAVSFLKHTEVW